MGYQPGLDGLRAISVIAVVFYHAGFSWMHGGFLGVEVFFVISGFIVPYSMVRANYGLSLWPRFMAKRLIRLEPREARKNPVVKKVDV
jgi:peptidoglycan/LPS O-acetylase OafA/YrhL